MPLVCTPACFVGEINFGTGSLNCAAVFGRHVWNLILVCSPLPTASWCSQFLLRAPSNPLDLFLWFCSSLWRFFSLPCVDLSFSDRVYVRWDDFRCLVHRSLVILCRLCRCSELLFQPRCVVFPCEWNLIVEPRLKWHVTSWVFPHFSSLLEVRWCCFEAFLIAVYRLLRQCVCYVIGDVIRVPHDVSNFDLLLFFICHFSS